MRRLWKLDVTFSRRLQPYILSRGLEIYVCGEGLAEQHSRPDAFKFELCTSGKAGMWYCHWSSEGDWKGDGKGNPFYLLKGLPSMKPSLSLGLSLQKSSMEVISSGVQSCSERFTLQEREWCNSFGEEEESKRRMWESFTDQELIHGGQLNWCLDKLTNPHRKIQRKRQRR